MPALITEGLLKPHPFLQNCSEAFLNCLEEFSTEMGFRKGEVLFKEGDYADRFYLILTGKIAVESCSCGERSIIQILGPGDLLGWSWLYPPFKYHFGARALEDGTAIQVAGAPLLIRAQEDPKFGFELMSRASQELIRRLEATRQAIREGQRIHRLN